ncbi:hypothetical protein [Pseudomonas aeruginosa]|uniref:hypothetical protein n=1 Tax=Pseudomonas aeruginosa TaxID=287 RepID=UPI001B37D72B|nr:hypothetical protein [Pseudomonas aeruginosa]MBP8363017.1 hypothetical protein [Pseudomonas aeruginosa]
MSEVHRFSVVKMLSEAGNNISYDPHGPEIVMAKDYDALAAEAQALRDERDEWRRLFNDAGNAMKNCQTDLATAKRSIVNLEETRRALTQGNKQLRAELEALRARVVVVPEPLNEGDARRECGEYGVAMQRGYNACLRELARINGLTVSEGLLRRLCEPLLSHADYVVARNELRALLNEDKENGNG